MDLTEKTLSAQRVFEGRLIHVRHDQVCLPDGQKTVREVVEHPGGVAIAALTEEGQILLVDQFRYAQQRVMREVPAGKLERGEDPRKAALRELEEETGYRTDGGIHSDRSLSGRADLDVFCLGAEFCRTASGCR